MATLLQENPAYAKPAIDAAYEDMVASMRVPAGEEDHRLMRAAYELAEEAHRPQRRKSGEPYIFHPIAVAKICAEEIGLGPTAICAALLHDTVEDTDVTLDEIRDRFGDRICAMVNGLTKLDSAYNMESAQAENFRKVLMTLVEDVRIVFVKMADRMHNMRTLDAMPDNKQLSKAAETSYIYAPLAHRLGMYNFRTEFLDRCMKIIQRDEYKEIADKLQETKKAREEYIETFIQPLREELEGLGVKYKIFGRPKSIYSIYNKLKNKQVPFEEIYDLFAVRVILDLEQGNEVLDSRREKTLCWQVYTIIADYYTPIPSRLKDWVSNPKSNGYESLHTTVMGPEGRYVEVQIRTDRMDNIAERGFAAHWKYKGVKGQKDVYEQWLDSVRELLDDPTSQGNAVQFVGDFRANNFFNDEVYAYTPKGDMKLLPKGATVLDFAFAVHTEVGYQCQSIKIDNRLVPLSREVKNGDQIEIITRKGQRPNQDWLRIAKTGKAKAKIRHALREDRNKIADLGKETLERKLRNAGVKEKEWEVSMDNLVKFFEFTLYHDLYYAIAEETITTQQIMRHFEVSKEGRLVEIEVEKPVGQEPPTTTIERSGRRKSADRAKGKARLLINGEPGEQYEHSFAPCCNPVQGDEVFAYLASTAGLRIHRTNCPNAINLMANYRYRIMKAEWISTTESSFVTNLRITGVDTGKGVIENISHEISSLLDLNIRSMNISGHDGFFEATISILVVNVDQLRLAIKALEKLDSVSTVSREDGEPGHTD
ncbi:MAG: RelA/SpoT family protein [Saprospiraceae bacterium]